MNKMKKIIIFFTISYILFMPSFLHAKTDSEGLLNDVRKIWLKEGSLMTLCKNRQSIPKNKIIDKNPTNISSYSADIYSIEKKRQKIV